MKLVAQLQLQPTPAQSLALEATLRAANSACQSLSALAWQHQQFGKFDLHHLGYHAVRQQSGLSAQVVICCLSKVADAYKADHEREREFGPLGSIAYDDRILRYHDDNRVSIWTTAGRQSVRFVCGEHQRALLQGRKGQSDLCLNRGKWFLLATCEVEAASLKKSKNTIGVDFGIREIAVTSQGQSYGGAKIKALRRKTREHRRRLQKRGTKSARRRLKKAAGRQARFVRDTNHCISKKLVQEAKASKKALVLENLKGIRQRSHRLNKEMRWQIGNWAFDQLRRFVEYKAQLAGVECRVVRARNTSRRCYKCGHCEKANRVTQKRFVCVKCGHSDDADINAAKNIALRGTVNCPTVSNANLETNCPVK